MALSKRFFLSPKTKCIWQRDFATLAEVKIVAPDYIKGLHNSQRLHSKRKKLLFQLSNAS